MITMGKINAVVLALEAGLRVFFLTAEANELCNAVEAVTWDDLGTKLGCRVTYQPELRGYMLERSGK